MGEAVFKPSWLERLRAGLKRSSEKLAEGISEAFKKRRLDDEALEELEELLISADLGANTAARLVAEFSKTRFGKEVTDEEVRIALAESISNLLKPYAVPLEIDASKKPFVILMVGVNGGGKTTTIGKLAQYYREQGLKVIMAACDTFRAAATHQLHIWAERAGCPIVMGDPGGDAAALAYRALEKAKAEKFDVLLIDTAGRLQNRKDLMDELAKIVRVLKKLDSEAPHANLLVLDATIGQNAHSQMEIFREMTNVTGIVLTKLDGSAKGGVVVALADKFKLPIHAIGVGERVGDLRPFDAEDFAKSLLGLEEE